MTPNGRGYGLASVDILRGFVLVVMAIDRVRDYFNAQRRDARLLAWGRGGDGGIYGDQGDAEVMSMRSLTFTLLLVVCLVTQAAAQDGRSPAFVQVKTDDGIVLSGAVWTPRNPKPTAMVMTWTGEFFEYAEWGRKFAEQGFLTVSLNRRDSGAQHGYNLFEPSARDVKYAVDLAFRSGARHAVVVGLSYGTVVTSYYVTNTGDTRVSGAVLLSPLAELRTGNIKLTGEASYDEALKTARSMIASGKGSDVFIEPGTAERTGRPAFTTYEVFVNKRGPDSKAAPAELLKTVKIPVLAVRDPGDPSPGTLPPAQQRLEAATPRLTYVLLPAGPAGRNGGVIHRLGGRESEVVGLVLRWLEKHGL